MRLQLQLVYQRELHYRPRAIFDEKKSLIYLMKKLLSVSQHHFAQQEESLDRFEPLHIHAD